TAGQVVVPGLAGGPQAPDPRLSYQHEDHAGRLDQRQPIDLGALIGGQVDVLVPELPAEPVAEKHGVAGGVIAAVVDDYARLRLEAMRCSATFPHAFRAPRLPAGRVGVPAV